MDSFPDVGWIGNLALELRNKVDQGHCRGGFFRWGFVLGLLVSCSCTDISLCGCRRRGWRRGGGLLCRCAVLVHLGSGGQVIDDVVNHNNDALEYVSDVGETLANDGGP